MAFLSTPGTLWLYSGVRNRKASPSLMVWFQRFTIGSEYVGSAISPMVAKVSANIGSGQSRRSSTSTAKPPWAFARSTSQGETRSEARPSRVLPMMILSVSTVVLSSQSCRGREAHAVGGTQHHKTESIPRFVADIVETAMDKPCLRADAERNRRAIIA